MESLGWCHARVDASSRLSMQHPECVEMQSAGSLCWIGERPNRASRLSSAYRQGVRWAETDHASPQSKPLHTDERHGADPVSTGDGMVARQVIPIGSKHDGRGLLSLLQPASLRQFVRLQRDSGS